MANDLPITNGVNGHGPSEVKEGGESSFSVKAGLARMLKGGVIMDVVNPEQVRNNRLIIYAYLGTRYATSFCPPDVLLCSKLTYLSFPS